MPAFADTGPLARAVIDTLEADGFVVGEGTGAGLSTPYAVVYGPGEEQLSGTLDDPDEAVSAVVHVKYVASTDGQPQDTQQGVGILRDRGRALLMDRTNVSVAGYSTARAKLDRSRPPVADPQDETHSTFYVDDYYDYWLEPT